MMKNHLFPVMLSVFMIILLFCPVQAAISKIEVGVDPGIELLTAVQLLSNYPHLTNFDFDYKQEMLYYFSPYRNHPAVKLFSRMARSNFDYDAPPAVMLYLSDPPSLELEQPFSEYLKGRAGGEKRSKKFVQELRDFAVESNFMGFYNNHRQFYKKLVADVEKKIRGYDYAVTLENYYRIKQAGYYIILAPLFHPGGYGPRIEVGEGRFKIYNICGSIAANGGYPVFGDEQRFEHLAWHEFSHSFINPITEEYRSEINKYSSLYLPIAEKMQKQAYSNWETTVNEHLVRAVTIRLTYLENGKEAGDRALLNEKRRGFAYVDPLGAALEKYENHPKKFSNFEEFYPEFIKVFKELSEKNLGEGF